MNDIEKLRYRIAPLEMNESEFRRAGHLVIERIAEWMCSLPNRPVAPNEAPGLLREALGTGSLPEQGADARNLLEEAATLLFEHSTFNGHPRFWGVITSSAAPIGALGDVLAAAVNPNVGGWALAPIATEMEAQTIRWIADVCTQ
jgi:aromatic-L-amino-acid/L-tryptophan decarboxylase